MNTGKLSIRCYNVVEDVSKLSGGNQRKGHIQQNGCWRVLMADPDEPTRA